MLSKAIVEGSGEFQRAKRLVDELPAKLKAAGSEVRWIFAFHNSDKPLISHGGAPIDDPQDSQHLWLMGDSEAYREARTAVDVLKRRFPEWHFALTISGNQPQRPPRWTPPQEW